MRQPRSGSLAGFLLLLLATANPCAAHGRTRRSGGFLNHIPESAGAERSEQRLFPLLTSLRDGAIEYLFGRHPSKSDQSSLTPARKTQYKDEMVLRFNISTTDQEAALAEAATRLFTDVWAFTNDFVDVRLHKNEIAPFLGLLPESLHSAHSTLIPHLSAAVYQSLPSDSYTDVAVPERVYLELASSSADNLFFADYQPLSVVIRWMQLLEAMFPSYVNYINIGASFEGRDIPGLRVGVPPVAGSTEPRKTLVLAGGLHAREWISTTSVNYVAWSFITQFGKEPMITKLLDEFDIIFLPVVNPDGVEYTWTTDRLWRKSRQETPLRFCRGLDLDHAFDFGWHSSSATADPCSESYAGEEPFEAVEAWSLAKWAQNEVAQNHVRFVAFIDLHSYSQQVLFPYSSTCEMEPPNMENLQEVAVGIAKAIRLSKGQLYSVTSACKGAVAAGDHEDKLVRPTLQSGGGSAMDWFYHEMRAHYSYQIKLRDTGSHGFLLPKEQIVPVGEEMFDAIKYFGDFLLGNNGIERSHKGSEAETHPDTEFESHELRRRKLRR